MWNISKAHSCANYLKFHGNVDNVRRIITINFGGKFSGYRGHGEFTFWKYYFRDSDISVRFFRDEQEERRAEIVIGKRTVAVI